MLILQGVRFLVTPRQRSVSLISEYVICTYLSLHSLFKLYQTFVFPGLILHIWYCRKCSNRPDLKYYSGQNNGPFKCCEHTVDYISISVWIYFFFEILHCYKGMKCQYLYNFQYYSALKSFLMPLVWFLLMILISMLSPTPRGWADICILGRINRIFFVSLNLFYADACQN